MSRFYILYLASLLNLFFAAGYDLATKNINLFNYKNSSKSNICDLIVKIYNIDNKSNILRLIIIYIF